MADVFQDSFKQFANKKQEILSRLADTHEERIINTLKNLEDEIISDLTRITEGGVKLNTQLAIELRPNLKSLIEKNFLKEADSIVSEYDEIVKEYQRFIKPLPIPDKFKTLTKPDLKVINDLKFLSFSGFEDMGNRFLDTIANEVYQSSVTGRPFNEMVKNIRGQINGVYQRSNEAAVNRLVDYIDKNRYSENAAIIKKVKNAREILHTKYASDILGNNMRRYAGQIAQDSLMQFDGQFTLYKGKEAGITKFQYVGTNITTTRSFCRRYLDRVFTEEEARAIWQQSWRGKSGTDPFVNRGGYRCRHSFIPYDDAWFNEDTNENIKEQTKTNDKQRKEQAKDKPKERSFNINRNKVYSSFDNNNVGEFGNIMNNLEGQEISNQKISKFMEKHGITALFLSKQVTGKSFRQSEFKKVNEQYKKNLPSGDSANIYERSYPLDLNEADINRYPRSNVNGYASPINNAPVTWITETDDFTKVDTKILQKNTEKVINRTKNGEGSYVTKGKFGEKKNADWSFSSGATSSEEQKIKTMLHEIGHQVHFYASTDNSGLFSTNTFMDIYKNASKEQRKNFILTKYQQKNKYEQHAELFTAYATNRKALEKYNPSLVEYMDNLMDKAINSSTKGY